MSLLYIDDLRVSYGGIEALKGISIQVEKGEIVTPCSHQDRHHHI